jgi:hypothetical protein
MCRNIKTLYNFDPPASDDEIYASALQFVRKLSGFSKPSKANEAVFDEALEEVASAARRLVDSLVTNAPPRNREVEAEKARARTAKRFGSTASAPS